MRVYRTSFRGTLACLAIVMSLNFPAAALAAGQSPFMRSVVAVYDWVASLDERWASFVVEEQRAQIKAKLLDLEQDLAELALEKCKFTDQVLRSTDQEREKREMQEALARLKVKVEKLQKSVTSLSREMTEQEQRRGAEVAWSIQSGLEEKSQTIGELTQMLSGTTQFDERAVKSLKCEAHKSVLALYATRDRVQKAYSLLSGEPIGPAAPPSGGCTVDRWRCGE